MDEGGTEGGRRVGRYSKEAESTVGLSVTEKNETILSFFLYPRAVERQFPLFLLLNDHACPKSRLGRQNTPLNCQKFGPSKYLDRQLVLRRTQDLWDAESAISLIAFVTLEVCMTVFTDTDPNFKPKISFGVYFGRTLGG